jgi:protein subunit release factor A
MRDSIDADALMRQSACEMNLTIEIRAAEGGDDAKSLVLEQVRIYTKLCARHGL